MTADVGEVEQQRRYDEGRPASDEVGNRPVTEPAGVPLLRDAAREVRVTVGRQHAAEETVDDRLPHAGSLLFLCLGGLPLKRWQQHRVDEMLHKSVV